MGCRGRGHRARWERGARGPEGGGQGGHLGHWSREVPAGALEGGVGECPGVTASSWHLMAGAGHTGAGTQGGCLGFPRGSSARSVIRGGPGKSTRSRGCRCLRSGSGGAWRGACALGSVMTVVVPHETLPSKSCRVLVLAPLQDPCLGATLRLPHSDPIVLWALRAGWGLRAGSGLTVCSALGS